MAPQLAPTVRAALDEIRARPDDDTPRLMLADWLEEHGDATDAVRARLLREQCTLARRDPADPLRFADGERLDDLLLRHGDELDGPARNVLGTWHRGLRAVQTYPGELDALHARPDRLAWTERLGFAGLPLHEEVSQVAARLRAVLAGVRQLALDTGERTPDWLTALRGPELRRLTHLAVTGPVRVGNSSDALLAAGPFPDLVSLRTHHADLDRLAAGEATPTLRELHLGQWWSSLEPLFASRHLRHLERVVLTSVQQAALTLPAAAGLPALRSLRVSGLADGVSVLANVARSPFWLRLEELELPHLPLSPAILRTLVPAPRLRKLDLTQTRLDPGGAEQLRALPWPALATLLLRRNALDPDGAAHLARAHLPALRTLDLGACNLGPTGAAHLAEAAWLAGVCYLDLGWNGIEPAGLRPLLARSWSELRGLNLDENRLGDAGVELLHALESRAPHLVGLHLKGNRIGDAGAVWLARWPYLGRLRVLDLQVNRIGDVGGRALLESPHVQTLEYLALGINDLSDDLRRAFRARFGYRVVLP